MLFPIIPQNLSITAMRSSGYRDSAHALAELVDNAIQAGQELGGTTQVELLCVDEMPSGAVRKRIARIAVYDNAAGMNADALRKALQFGNGSRLDPKNQRELASSAWDCQIRQYLSASGLMSGAGRLATFFIPTST